MPNNKLEAIIEMFGVYEDVAEEYAKEYRFFPNMKTDYEMVEAVYPDHLSYDESYTELLEGLEGLHHQTSYGYLIHEGCF